MLATLAEYVIEQGRVEVPFRLLNQAWQGEFVVFASAPTTVEILARPVGTGDQQFVAELTASGIELNRRANLAGQITRAALASLAVQVINDMRL